VTCCVVAGQELGMEDRFSVRPRIEKKKKEFAIKNTCRKMGWGVISTLKRGRIGCRLRRGMRVLVVPF
jgi:hypothetical protein